MYKRTLRLFATWIATTGRTPETLTKADIVAYSEELLNSKKSTLTVTSYITVLKKFYAWTEAGKIYPNIANGVKTPKRKQSFRKEHLTEDKSRELLEHAQSENLRNYAIVSLLLRTGLRTIEAIRADVGDITTKGGQIILKVWGKGRDEKDDFVVLTEKAYTPIREYLQTRPDAKDEEPLFLSDSHRNQGARLTTRSISRICKNGLKAIGLDRREFSAHSLRHTTAVTILKAGGNIEQAQAVLRHANPATTEIYTESIKEELRLKNAPERLIDGVF